MNIYVFKAGERFLTVRAESLNGAQDALFDLLGVSLARVVENVPEPVLAGNSMVMPVRLNTRLRNYTTKPYAVGANDAKANAQPNPDVLH